MAALPDADADTALAPRRFRAWLAGVVVVAVLIYAPSLGFQLTWDDLRTVQRHPGVQGPLSLGNLFGLDYWGRAFGAPDAIGTFRPLVTASYWLDVHLSRSPAALHATNLLLFALVLLVGERALRRFALGDRARLFAVALFAALAIHVDVVPSVTGRSELVAAIFALLALDLGFAAVTRSSALPLALACLAGALLSKESTLPFALVIPLLAWRRAAREDRGRVALLAAGSLALLAALLVFRAKYLPFRVQGMGWRVSDPLIEAPTSLRLAGVGQAFAHYLEHTVAPIDLCPDYGYASLVPRVGARAALGWGVIVAALGLTGWSFRRAPRAFDALLALGGSYVVVSHLLLASSAFVADRQFFFPSFFLCALAAMALERLSRTAPRVQRLLPIPLATLLLGQLVLTAVAIPAWRDNVALTAYAVQNCPSSMRMQIFRSEVLHERGAHEDAAWATLLAGTIFAGFPEPLDEETFAELTDAPADRRVALFAKRFGHARAAQLLAYTADALAQKGYAEALAVVRRWSVELAASGAP